MNTPIPVTDFGYVGSGRFVNSHSLHFCVGRKTYIISILRLLNHDIDDYIMFLVNLRKILQGVENIKIKINELYINIQGNIIECYCKEQFERTAGIKTFICNADEVLPVFTECYHSICKHLFLKTNLWKPYCKKWILFSSSFEKQLTKAIDENPHSSPIDILGKM